MARTLSVHRASLNSAPSSAAAPAAAPGSASGSATPSSFSFAPAPPRPVFQSPVPASHAAEVNRRSEVDAGSLVAADGAALDDPPSPFMRPQEPDDKVPEISTNGVTTATASKNVQQDGTEATAEAAKKPRRSQATTIAGRMAQRAGPRPKGRNPNPSPRVRKAKPKAATAATVTTSTSAPAITPQAEVEVEVEVEAEAEAAGPSTVATETKAAPKRRSAKKAAVTVPAVIATKAKARRAPAAAKSAKSKASKGQVGALSAADPVVPAIPEKKKRAPAKKKAVVDPVEPIGEPARASPLKRKSSTEAIAVLIPATKKAKVVAKKSTGAVAAGAPGEQVDELKAHEDEGANESDDQLDDDEFKATGVKTAGKRVRPVDTRRYTCTYLGCDRVFARNFNLNAHFATHQGIRDYGCSECGKLFSRRHDCTRHCIAVHGADRDKGKKKVLRVTPERAPHQKPGIQRQPSPFASASEEPRVRKHRAKAASADTAEADEVEAVEPDLPTASTSKKPAPKKAGGRVVARKAQPRAPAKKTAKGAAATSSSGRKTTATTTASKLKAKTATADSKAKTASGSGSGSATKKQAGRPKKAVESLEDRWRREEARFDEDPDPEPRRDIYVGDPVGNFRAFWDPTY